MTKELRSVSLNVVKDVKPETLRVQIALTDIDPIDDKFKNTFRTGAGAIVSATTGIPQGKRIKIRREKSI